MKVLPQNKLRIVCPSSITINDWIGRYNRDRYQNFWLVDKNGYDNCKVNDDTNPSMNKLIMTCNSPKNVIIKTFQFHPRFSQQEPRFVPGRHYYFIATGGGDAKTLQDKSGGHCTKYHMKLHIYVCNPKKETCIWEQPYCEPTYEFERVMTSYSRSLPPPTRGVVTLAPLPPTLPPSPSINKQAMTFRPTNVIATEPKNGIAEEQRDRECQNEDDGASVHMILNFVLGGVILFMAVVIVILSCGLARKSEPARPASGAFSAVSTQEPNGNLYQESARYIQPLYTPAKSPPQTPISLNPPFYLAPMAEIRPRSSSNRNAFNNAVYGRRQDSVDAQAGQIEVSPMLSDNYPNTPEPV
ncbi:ephrin-B2a-like isoform X1 [Paramuricea clavata]|nr:ephrin-B2a-like isoform X1 [Paramuricea clavata]